MGVVLSLYDYTGEALKPWADAGHDCYAFDIQHDPHEVTKEYYGNGFIEYHYGDLHDPQSFVDIKRNLPFMDHPVIFGMGRPHISIQGQSSPSAENFVFSFDFFPVLVCVPPFSTS